MKKTLNRLLLAILTITIISTVFISKNVSFAANPFVTVTVDRHGDIVETQDAYESIIKYKNIGSSLLSNPSDIFIDDEDYIYIADTGNKRVVILDNEFNFVTELGTTELEKPTGVYVRNSVIYVADYGTDQDKSSGKVCLYDFNKETSVVTLKEVRKTPGSKVLEIDNFIYRPKKIAVDTNLTMYVVSEGSYSGILTISNENRFMSYFAPNSVSVSLLDRVKRFLYEDNDKVTLKDNLPTEPYNVHIDDSGYIYTVTKTITKNNLSDALKKVNIGGTNFFPKSMISGNEFVSTWNGKYGNVFGITTTGFIYEYDFEGNVLFIFGGTSTTIDQLGLFKSASGIVVNSKDELIVLDANDNSLQVFSPTIFASTVHAALGLYNDGKYIESKELWEEVLVYNSMFDLANKGIGLAYYLNGDYEQALKQFKLAYDKEDYSEAYWEIRNVWISNNIVWIFAVVLVLILGIFVLLYLEKKHLILTNLKEKFKKLSKKKWINDALLMFKMLRHPLDATYYFKTDKKIKYYNGIIFAVLLFVIYILGLTSTGFLFNNVVIERTVLLKEAFKIMIPLALFIVANYLASSLLDGEGTFKGIFLTTIGSTMPIIVIYPVLILISNFLTYNESFIFYFGIIAMLGWSAVLLFVTNKELHNYTGKQMFLNIIMTILLMLVLLIVVILAYLMFAQVVEFVKDIVSEVIFHA